MDKHIKSGFSTPATTNLILYVAQALEKQKLRQKEDRTVYLTPAEMPRVVKFLLDVNQLGHLEPLFLTLTKKLTKIWSLSKAKFVVMVMKECSISLMKWKAGEVYSVNQDCRISIHRVSRLPSIIPLDLRSIMISDEKVYRCVLSVFNLYRVITFGGQLKLNTITDPLKDGAQAELSVNEIQNALKDLVADSVKPVNWSLPEARFKLILKSGPNHSTSIMGAGLDGVAMIFSNFRIFLAYSRLSLYIPKGPTLCLTMLLSALLSAPIVFMMRVLGFNNKLIIGKLERKVEAAGKIRVFAITDYWTQCLLEPIHKSIFSFFEGIPQDGTHDQNRPLQVLRSRLHSNSQV